MKKQRFDHYAKFVFTASNKYGTEELEKILRRALRSLPKGKRGSIKPGSILVDEVEWEEA